ncbi:MAG: cytochrome bd quinol oxidase subunit 1 apoprotein [Gemmataceae bacterium]|nr:cytochrome bd quinol oxidase subunit 1 apoprotein [Gemmataceae bacterium]
MDFDTLTLSRIQFAMTIMFHYLFPPLSIGLGVLLVAFEWLHRRTGDPDYRALGRFWTQVFAVNFTVGVATGIVMEFQFGSNWARFSRFAGDVFGSALAAEGIFAFFLESGFLAILVFGWDRVSPRTHFIATVMVAAGATFSAIWIVVANSWMNTPAGHQVVVHDGVPRAEVVDFWAMVFNPSSVHRVIHVVLGAYILGAFFVMSVSAWHLLRGVHERASRKALQVALVFAAVTLAAIFISGDMQARKVASTQPAKLAAFEGHYRTGEGGTEMALIGWPDDREKRLTYSLSVPGLLSFLVYGDTHQPVAGLDQFSEQDRPPVKVPFAAYHLMVYTWGALTGLVALAGLQWYRGQLARRRWLLWTFVAAVVLPYAANQAGWVATEVGRQPWVVQGIMRTSEAHSRSLPASQVLTVIVLYGLVYALLFVVWVRLLNHLIQRGPVLPAAAPAVDHTGPLLDTAARRTGGPAPGHEGEAAAGQPPGPGV